jgi:outer membrane biosynthesis protein TonB
LRSPLSRKPLGARSLLVAAAAIAIVHVVQAADQRSSRKAMKKYEAAHPGVLSVGKGIQQPSLSHKVEPDWESIPREKRFQRGPIMVEAVISAEGTVLDPTVVSEPQPSLDPVFLAALKQWKYEPARKAGKPVAVFLVVTVMF